MRFDDPRHGEVLGAERGQHRPPLRVRPLPGGASARPMSRARTTALSRSPVAARTRVERRSRSRQGAEGGASGSSDTPRRSVALGSGFATPTQYPSAAPRTPPQRVVSVPAGRVTRGHAWTLDLSRPGGTCIGTRRCRRPPTRSRPAPSRPDRRRAGRPRAVRHEDGHLADRELVHEPGVVRVWPTGRAVDDHGSPPSSSSRRPAPERSPRDGGVAARVHPARCARTRTCGSRSPRPDRGRSPAARSQRRSRRSPGRSAVRGCVPGSPGRAASSGSEETPRRGVRVPDHTVEGHEYRLDDLTPAFIPVLRREASKPSLSAPRAASRPR